MHRIKFVFRFVCKHAQLTQMERQLSNPAGHMFSSQYTVEYMPGGSEETNDERKEIKDFEQTRP
jgi:hypothetical protein